jgi:CMP-N,N'-diacetyllegionaminic acid synthase
MAPVVAHAVSAVESEGWRPEIVLVLQPTAPLRRPEHIRLAVERIRETEADSVVSVVRVPEHLSPDYVLRLADGRLTPFLDDGTRVTRRQDARPAWFRDGTVYAVRRDVLMERQDLYGDDCRPMILEADEMLTLDTEADWAEAERRLSR